jgi:purine catabolism regulator
VRAGRAGLVREVAWAVSARPGAPLFPTLKGGELARAAATALARLDPPASLAQLIAGLAERNAAGLALRGPMTPAESAAAEAAAEAAALPLILLPPATALADVERAVTALVHERRNELYLRTTTLHDLQLQLADQAGSGRILHAISEALAGLTSHAVAVAQPPSAPLSHISLPPGAPGEQRQALRQIWTALGPTLAERLAPAARSGSDGDLLLPAWPVADTGGERVVLVAPVVVRAQVVAVLLLLADAPATGLDQLTLARAAGVAGLELARDRLARRARPAAPEQDDSTFFRALICGGGSDAELRAQAQALGLPVARGYAVALVVVGSGGRSGTTPHSRALDEVALTGPAHTGEPAALWRILDGRLLIVWPLEGAAPSERDRPAAPPERLRAIAEAARAEVARRTGSPATAGLGHGYMGLSGIARSAVEAEQAVALGGRLFGGGAVWSYAELGVYRLLLPLRAQHAAELRTFLADTLGPLATDRRPAVLALLDTLDAYLAHGGNASQAAAALHLHRNTLAYRLRRVAQLTGLDVDDPEARLHLHLALKVRRLL